MAWYWWILIAAGVLGLGALKLLVYKKILEKKKAAQLAKDNEDD